MSYLVKRMRLNVANILFETLRWCGPDDEDLTKDFRKYFYHKVGVDFDSFIGLDAAENDLDFKKNGS